MAVTTTTRGSCQVLPLGQGEYTGGAKKAEQIDQRQFLERVGRIDEVPDQASCKAAHHSFATSAVIAAGETVGV